MRFLCFDQYEFEYPESEEILYVAIAQTEEYQYMPGPRAATPDETLQLFLDAALRMETRMEVQPRRMRPLSECPARFIHTIRNKTTVCDYLRKAAHAAVDPHDDWPVYTLYEEWDDEQHLIVTPRELIWYHWYTTA